MVIQDVLFGVHDSSLGVLAVMVSGSVERPALKDSHPRCKFVCNCAADVSNE